MKKLLLAGAVFSLVGGIAGSPALAQKPDKNATLTIAVSPTPITFGTYTGISGQLSSKQQGIALILQAQPHPFTGNFEDVGTTTTLADGNYTFSHLPSMNTHYRVVTKEKPAVRSPEAGVQVRWKVSFGLSDRTPKKGTRVRFYGTVKPAYPNGTVLIQKKTAAGWKTVKQTVMTTGTAAASKYSVRL
ncbi:MAG TPA: hypothetical protein VFV66_37915, partial [Nonomuraea sp.]|nr:hypothetical protein [Nonomuraea sp.]